MAQRLIYSINELFDKNSDNSVLRDNNAEKYFIPPYQRGYKWSSESRDSPVYKLMTDLFTAYYNSKAKKEYYLQFITVKNKEDKKVLEVIDGQQRLTTLTILLSILQNKISPDQPSIAEGLLSYEVRDIVMDFLNKFIYTNIEKIKSIEWADLIEQNENYDEQDIWYIFAATKRIENLLEDEFSGEKEKYQLFSDFILNNVKILLNNIILDISAEEVFSNLNSNKVELSNADLVKGLLLTYSAREINSLGKTKYYGEIVEIRRRMGRQWDEISQWANTGEIKQFYFSKRPINRALPLESFLLAFAILEGYNQKYIKNDIFNFLEYNIRNNNFTASDCFDKMKTLKLVLDEWYNNNDIHNKLGYLFLLKTNQNYSINDFLKLIDKSKSQVNQELKNAILKILNNIDPSSIEYGNDEVNDILLALNIFDNYVSFDFFQYNNNSWSLEHIFPQTPEKLPEKLGYKDLELIKTLLNDVLEDFNVVKDKLYNLYIDNVEEIYSDLKKKYEKNSLEYTEDEKRILYELMKTEKLNSIGNMALLTREVNSSNTNGVFDFKRINIAKKVSEGSFVPKHTYDVFSKLFSNEVNKDLITWNDKDIEAHTNFIVSKIKKIKDSL